MDRLAAPRSWTTPRCSRRVLPVPVAVLACVLVCAAYVATAAGLRRRGDAWPWRRDYAFLPPGAWL